MWWLSTRQILRRDHPLWPHYFANHPYEQVIELRTIDPFFNPNKDDRSVSPAIVFDLAELPKVASGLSQPLIGQEYFQLVTNNEEFEAALFADCPQYKPTLLGYDLGEAESIGGVSTLTNCGMWTGKLEALARRVNSYGLLSQSDAVEAQALLPSEWPGDPHGITGICTVLELRAVL
jgi:hypothetical protein